MAAAGLAYAGALVAGFTLNGVFAFGEEYGWRGWLAEELRPLGAFWANLLTGVLWGAWHAPLILLGYNYAGYAKLGTAFMIAWCVPASFLLWRARQVTDSLIAPAVVLHGAINGLRRRLPARARRHQPADRSPDGTGRRRGHRRRGGRVLVAVQEAGRSGSNERVDVPELGARAG